jgi:nuclear GTP-binding protein
MVKKSKKSKSKRVTLRQKHKVLRKVKEHHRKKRKEAKKEGKAGRKKVEKDPGIPNEWPFKEQELKALEARRAQALQELELKKEARKERVHHLFHLPCMFFLSHMVLLSVVLFCY